MTTTAVAAVASGTLILLILGGCGSPRETPSQASAPAPQAPPEAAPVKSIDGPPPNDGGPPTVLATARLLAGMAVDDPRAHELIDTEVWRQHASRMDGAWAAIESRYLEPIRRWSEAEIPRLVDPKAPLFYPFGGPDILNAATFFPEAGTYVLVGLEAPGDIPHLERLDPEGLEAELRRLRGVLDNLAEAGYFVRKEMRDDLAGDDLTGMASVLYILLARMGLTPRSAEYVEISEDGTAHAAPQLHAEEARSLHIQCSDAATGETRHIYFLSQDLSDDGLTGRPAFARFVERLGRVNSYMKSAQYLPHMEGFATIGDLVVEHSLAVLQDDSGLPLRRFPKDRFEFLLYGHYETTLPIYREWFQEDLKQLSDDPRRRRELGFEIGYNSRIGSSALLLAYSTEASRP